MDYAAFSRVVVGQSVPVVRQLLTASVCCCRNSTATSGSPDDLYAAMVDCGYHFLSVGVWGNPIVTYVTSFRTYHFMVYKCALREVVSFYIIKEDVYLLLI